jgi:hypothetical protein
MAKLLLRQTHVISFRSYAFLKPARLAVSPHKGMSRAAPGGDSRHVLRGRCDHTLGRGILEWIRALFRGFWMRTQGVIAGLYGLTILAACGHRPTPEPTVALGRDSDCVQDTTRQDSATQDSGVALGQDVSRGPRYRVDSSGRVETLPPVPAAGTDTAQHGCQAVPDSSRETMP